MKFRATIVVMSTLAMLAGPACAAAGGQGQGQGQGHGHGGGGAGGASASASGHSHGHGNATSAAAQDKSTTGIAHAIGVVGTTSAAVTSHALSALQSALDAMTSRSTDDGED